MKKANLLLILLLLLGITINAQVEPIPPQNDVAYPIEAATVEYSMTMMGTESQMTIYFKDYGKIQTTDMKLSLFGMNQHNRAIILNNKMYNLNFTNKTYNESVLTEEELKKNSTFLSEERIMEEEGVSKGETEIFLGKPCQTYTMNKDGNTAKFWAWEGLVLKMETTAQGVTVSFVAKSIKEEIPDKMYFEVPSDFTIEGETN